MNSGRSETSGNRSRSLRLAAARSCSSAGVETAISLAPDLAIFSLEGHGPTPKNQEVIARLEKDEFDLVAVGRALLADPHWVEKIREGRADELKDFERGAMAVLH